MQILSSFNKNFSLSSLMITMAIAFVSTASLQAITNPIPDEVIKSIEAHVAENSWPSIYYDVIPKVINKHKFKNIVEIGVALGGHAEAILQNTEVETYYGIDPYKYNYDKYDQFNIDVAKYSKESGQMNFNYLFQWVKDYRLSPYEGRVILIRETSVDASDRFENSSVDCIFVDGNHQYQSVVDDLTMWYPKLRKGGIILGDDYWMDTVSDAVNDYFKSQNKRVFFITSKSGYKIWAVYK